MCYVAEDKEHSQLALNGILLKVTPITEHQTSKQLQCYHFRAPKHGNSKKQLTCNIHVQEAEIPKFLLFGNFLHYYI